MRLQDLSIGPDSGEPEATREKKLSGEVREKRSGARVQFRAEDEMEMVTAICNADLNAEAARELAAGLQSALGEDVPPAGGEE